MTLDEAVEVLTTPPKQIPTADVLIPPGYRMTQIADAVEEALGIPADRFLARLDEGTFDRPQALPADAPLEGFLWPETYRIPKGDQADAVIQRLLDQFTKETANLPWDNAEPLGVTPYEIVVIASMIEKEAAVQADRPLIAGVIYNRLREGMTLGIDATLLYDDPTPDGKLSTSDIETDGPYNTRIRAGLPPTPIASPYLWSLRAALDPADTPYLYYVLCGDDGSIASPRRTTSIWPTSMPASAERSEPSAIGGATHVAGVIGWPVEHSLSPAIHNAAFVAAGLDWAYVPMPVAPGGARPAPPPGSSPSGSAAPT